MLVISGGFKSTRNCINLIFMCVNLLCILLKWAVIIYCASEAGGEARPADQETREAGPGGRQPGPEWRQRLAQVPPHEGDNRKSSTHFLSDTCQPAEHSFNQYCSSALVRSASCDLTLQHLYDCPVGFFFLNRAHVKWLLTSFRLVISQQFICQLKLETSSNKQPFCRWRSQRTAASSLKCCSAS